MVGGAVHLVGEDHLTRLQQGHQMDHLYSTVQYITIGFTLYTCTVTVLTPGCSRDTSWTTCTVYSTVQYITIGFTLYTCNCFHQAAAGTPAGPHC